MVDERTGLTRAIGKTKKILRNTYGSTDERKKEVGGGVVIAGSKQKYRKLNEDEMHYNCEADLMLDSVNRRYKKIVLTTYSMGMTMIIIGCLLVL